MIPDRRLRILTVANVPPDPNSGAAGTVYHTNVALRELGHHVDELWNHDLGQRKIAHGNLHSLLEQPRMYRDAVVRAVQKNAYDVVQMSQPQAWLAAKTLKRQGYRGVIVNRSHGLELRVDSVLPEWHRRMGIPESRFPRSLVTPVIRRLLQRQWPAAVRSSDAIVVTCEMDREFLVRNVPEAAGRTFAVHHGIGTDLTATEAPLLTTDRLRKILYVGQHSFIKGYHILAEVLNRSLKDHPSLSCTWVTAERGHSEVLGLLVPEIQNRVRLLGWRDQSQLTELYDSHGIFVFPSYFEGAGKASLEALSRRMAVVASDTGAMRDYLNESKGGILCEVGRAAEFSEAITSLISDPQAAATAAERGFQLAKDKTWQRCATGLVKIYETILAGRSARESKS